MLPVGGRRLLFSVSRALLFVLVLSLLFSSTGPLPAAEVTSAGVQVSMATTPLSTLSLNELAHSFRTLRAEPSRFDSPDTGVRAGCSEEVDSFDGKKHQVMEALRVALARVPSLHTDTVVAALGFPDLITLDTEVTRGRASQLDALSFMPGPVMPDGTESPVPDDSGEAYYFVYNWRGFHDYLWFRARGPLVEKIDWYYASH